VKHAADTQVGIHVNSSCVVLKSIGLRAALEAMVVKRAADTQVGVDVRLVACSWQAHFVAVVVNMSVGRGLHWRQWW
jgi:hypothetical protein